MLLAVILNTNAVKELASFHVNTNINFFGLLPN